MKQRKRQGKNAKKRKRKHNANKERNKQRKGEKPGTPPPGSRQGRGDPRTPATRDRGEEKTPLPPFQGKRTRDDQSGADAYVRFLLSGEPSAFVPGLAQGLMERSRSDTSCGAIEGMPQTPSDWAWVRFVGVIVAKGCERSRRLRQYGERVGVRVKRGRWAA